MELLAGTQAGEHDRDFARTQAGQADHVLGELDDVDRLTHVEHEKLAAGREAAGVEHEMHRLGNRHEITLHVRVGDRDRSAALDLMLEHRHHASAAAQHVAEPHHGERAAGSTRRLAHDHLGQPLGRPHHAGRRHGLVGRDHHQLLHVCPEAGVDEVARPHHVVGDRFFGIVFHQRHVFVRRGMKDDVRLRRAEAGLQPSAIANVGDHRLDGQRRKSFAQLRPDVEDAVLAVPDEREQ